MKYYTIGDTDLKGSAIAMGCMRIAEKDEKEVAAFVHTALEMGINYFDHADIYGGGQCEEKFGALLRLEPSLREKLLLQSKCGIRNGFYDFSKEYLLSCVDGILRRLHTDYLDVLLLHRPDALMEPEEVAEAFDQLKRQGKVRHFGVSNFSAMQLAYLQSAVSEPLCVNQLQFSILHSGIVDNAILANTTFPGAENRDGGILDYCRLQHVTLQAWSPFQYGFFEGSFIGSPKYPKLNKCLETLAEKYQTTPTAIAAAWILRHPAGIQIIAGTTRPERLAEICSACSIPLTRKEWYDLYLAEDKILP